MEEQSGSNSNSTSTSNSNSTTASNTNSDTERQQGSVGTGGTGSKMAATKRISFADEAGPCTPRSNSTQRVSLQHSAILPQTPPPPSSRSRRRRLRQWMRGDTARNNKAMGSSLASYSGLLSSRSSASGSTPPHSGKSPHDRALKTSRAVWFFRSFFWVLLFLVAVTLGSVAYAIITKSEHDLAQQQWLALTSRYLTLGRQIGTSRSIVVKSLAQIAATAFPDAADWPNVAIPNFVQTATELSRGGAEVSFFPKIMPQNMPPTLYHNPQEQSDFETFAYRYFYDTRYEEFHFDVNQGTVHGRGIWKFLNGTTPTSDTDGIVQTTTLTDSDIHTNTDTTTPWHTYYRYLFPLLQTTNPSNELFLFNAHSTRLMGEPLDEVIRCSDVRRQQLDPTLMCGIMTGTSSSHRTSYLIEPVFPVHDPFDFTGVVTSQFSWDSTLAAIFEDGIIPGLTAVLTGEGQNYTYQVRQGKVEFVGQGNLALPKYASYQRTVLVSGQDQEEQHHDDDDPYAPAQYMRQTSYYTLTLYPNDDFFAHYSTSLPMVTTCGAVLIVLLTSFMFLIYDFFVRQEFDSKRQLLEAKRHFMRFVSHEVRTPMNAVNMGLALLYDEIEQVNQARQSRRSNTSTSTNNHSHCTTTYHKEEEDEDVEQAQLVSSPPSIQQQPNNTCSSSTTAAASTCTDHCSPHCHECNLCNQNELKDLETSLGQWLILVQEICESADASVEVLNDLLHYDKIQMGSFTMEQTIFPLCSLVEEISKEFRLSARKKNISFELDTTPMLDAAKKYNSPVFQTLEDFKVVADRIRITQIARNLVSNAIKFTKEEGDIRITMSWVPNSRPKRKGNDVYTLQSGETISLPRRGMICLAVKDSGAGMSEDQLALLFQDGAQFNVNELQAGQGSGLGLYISKGMAEQHGGSLFATSEGLGKGTTFTLTIPLYWTPPQEPEESEFSSHAAAAAAATPMTMTPNTTVAADLENQLEPQQQQCAMEGMGPPSAPTSSVQRKDSSSKGTTVELPSLRILVVDDVASNRKLIARLARNRKHIVEEAFDGQDAVEKVQAAMREQDRSGYDVILMDYEMPRMNGPTAVREIRQLGCEALIVGVTGNVLAEDVAHFVNNGANEVLPKPVKFAKLEQIWMESSLID